MTEDSAMHPAAGGHGPLALRLGLGALLLTAVWLVASFFLDTASANAAEAPNTPPSGLLSSAVQTADALSADLDRAASTTLAVAALPVHAAPTPAPAPTPAASAPVRAGQAASAAQSATAAHSAIAAPVISMVQQTADALSDAASPVVQSPIVAPARVVTDAASRLVSVAAEATDGVAPTLSRDLIDPVTGTVQELLGTVTGIPVGDLPADATGLAPASWAPDATAGLESRPVSEFADGVLEPAGPAALPARQPLTGAHPGGGGAALTEASGAPGSLPAPLLPLPEPNGGAAHAGSDASGSPMAGPGAAADLTRAGFSPSALGTSSDGRPGTLPPTAPRYDSDSTPD